MSVYCSFFTPRRVFSYKGSNVVPSVRDEQDGWLDVAYPASHVPTAAERARGLNYICGREDGPGHPWLRLSVYSTDDENTVVLHKREVEKLRDALTDWLAMPKIRERKRKNTQ